MELKLTQMVYVNYKSDGKIYYDLGVIVGVYDQLILVQMKNRKAIHSCYYTQIIEEINYDKEGIVILKRDGKPVFSKQNWRGKYTFEPYIQ